MNTFTYKLVSALIVLNFKIVCGDPINNKNEYKDQYCTDPRTMAKHKAYSEWADAYSCTRHRCQPGGRNLAIYTVGCKRVEAPESAIECEEVVEDTNMQFPFCCTRLRCLVVVRGEVWTRVLGQPWETLPAAPWSHMYKMKKPPPSEITFFPKASELGPVYELTEQEDRKTTTPCNEVGRRNAVPTPDIVIALSTDDKTETKKKPQAENIRRKWRRKSSKSIDMFFDSAKDASQDRGAQDLENLASEIHDINEQVTEQPLPIEISEEKAYFEHTTKHEMLLDTQKQEFAKSQWHHDLADAESKDATIEDKRERKHDLQALVDAIGTRMKDIENVVQRMSEKVQQVPSFEKKSSRNKASEKLPNPELDDYERNGKYLHTDPEGTTEPSLYIGDGMHGYFSDASNNILRRSRPKEPPLTYMAPIDTHSKVEPAAAPTEKTTPKKKHGHKKRKGKSGHAHKKHRAKEEKKKQHAPRVSNEVEKNVVRSLEDSSGIS